MRGALARFCAVHALLLAGLATRTGWAQEPDRTLEKANAALQAGAADQALSLIASLPQGGTENAEAQSLECRVRYGLEQWNAAIAACQQAVNLDPENSEDHLWLGRALGEKASRASFMAAYTLGKQAFQQFQAATQLNPRNAAALADLGEYYVDAPAVLGGGLDKAESVAEALDRIDSARASELRAEIAQERNDAGAAEQELKKAVAASPHPSRQWATLARFYQQRRRWTEMDWAIENCIAAAARDPHAGVALYDGAGVLIKSDRDPALAAKMLEHYLASSDRTDEGPAFVAYHRLAHLKQALGDDPGAQQDEEIANELAHEYAPARDTKH